ncbi:MAG TPA: hypothetical protein VM261_07895 [Kofleriaceae bacterium]|nr:hypothetical protein [Kofleriaceae bacterium]
MASGGVGLLLAVEIWIRARSSSLLVEQLVRRAVALRLAGALHLHRRRGGPAGQVKPERIIRGGTRRREPELRRRRHGALALLRQIIRERGGRPP